ncbi:MAG TPA: AmmeMemoRadiSam system radical SAM enzyme, partial [Alphaproteobacteria bacterium]
LDKAPTPAATLRRARKIAQDCGIRYAYTGNIHDASGQSTWCHACGELLIERDWYVLGRWTLTPDDRCMNCGEASAGVFEAAPGAWGAKRRPVRLASYRVKRV